MSVPHWWQWFLLPLPPLVVLFMIWPVVSFYKGWWPWRG